jgi:hypothetical protein
MKVYTSIIQWLVPGKKHNYLNRSKTIRNIKAEDILKASEIALTHAPKGSIFPEVSCIWYE